MNEKILNTLSRHFWWLRQNYYIYRRQTLLLIVLGALFEVMIVQRDDPADMRYMLAVYGEVLLPQIAGWVVTGILVGDSSRELLFATSRPVWKTVIERLELVISTAMLSFGSLLLFTSIIKDKESFPNDGLKLFLGSVVACLLFTSIGIFSSVLLRNRAAGGVVITALWASALLFKENLLASDIGHIIYPFLTLNAPDNPFWIINRLTLIALSLLLIWGTIRLTQHEEPLLPHGESEEA